MAGLKVGSGGAITITGLEDMEKRLDATKQAQLGPRLLKAAEPHLTRALDTVMLAHPGALQKSLRSTGPQKNGYGGWYLAYRATTGNEKPGDIPNPQKMIYLTTRQFVKERKTKNGKIIRNYVIPADDVIGKAVALSETAVISAMESEFEKLMDEIWED